MPFPWCERTVIATLTLLLVSTAHASAQALIAAPPPIASPAAAVRLDGPPAPVAPAVVNRDEAGHATIRATRLNGPLVLDGRLDERIYSDVPGAGDFVQQVPQDNVPATEATEIWVFFDDRNLYIAARCFDSQPGREVVTEMRRDNTNMFQNDNISFVLDTFYDRRNGFFFQTSPLGTIRDQSIADDQADQSWNTVWDVRSATDDQGWTTEMVIPFKSLRYAGSGPQVWGINVRRIIHWKNEYDYLSAVPKSYGGGAVNRMSVGGTLVGVETPLQSVNLELKPYAVSSVSTDRAATVPYSNDVSKNVGFDFKYGLTRGLVLDTTVNTDFAQVEEDAQQVNLTRFSLFFPEKRDFFLEGQGLFAFGGAPFGTQGGDATSAEVPIMFFSRQIGLSNGQTVPVRAGARVTGRAGVYGIGALNIETGESLSAHAPSTNFTVLRVKRNVFRHSNFGVLATRRAPALGLATVAGGTNYAAGVDANFAFFQNVSFVGYYAKSMTPNARGGDASYRGRFDYDADRYGLQLEHIAIGNQFNPEVGYVRRIDFRRSYADARISRRPRNRYVRRVSLDGSLDYIENAARTFVQDREAKTALNVEFNNSDRFRIDYRTGYELLPRRFAIATGVIVPQGGYLFHSINPAYTVGQRRYFAGQVNASFGSLYNGTKNSVGLSGGYVSINRHVSFEPGISLNWVDLPYGRFTSRLVTNRAILTPTPRMIISSLMQYNAAAHAVSTSVRLNWEYRPSSQVFIVYSDGRETLSRGIPDLLNRSFTVKVTRLMRF